MPFCPRTNENPELNKIAVAMKDATIGETARTIAVATKIDATRRQTGRGDIEVAEIKFEAIGIERAGTVNGTSLFETKIAVNADILMYERTVVMIIADGTSKAVSDIAMILLGWKGEVDTVTELGATNQEAVVTISTVVIGMPRMADRSAVVDESIPNLQPVCTETGITVGGTISRFHATANRIIDGILTTDSQDPILFAGWATGRLDMHRSLVNMALLDTIIIMPRFVAVI